MSGEDLQCCLCKETFSSASHPRMMPHCQHSSCTPCLKTLLQDKTVITIRCRHCGHEQNLQETDLEYFPKNISLQKIIKDKAASPRVPNQTAEPVSSQVSEHEPELCSVHGKELEIICVTDREKVCPHCALFGKHKNHNLKTIAVVEAEMRERENLFQVFKGQKEATDQRISSKEFRQEVVAKIGSEKERVVSQIREKFSLLYENVKLAEKQAYEDVVKNFRNIYQKITALIKEENDCQVRYREWEQRCRRLFSEAESKHSLQEKAALYFGGPLEECLEGQQLIQQIEEKVSQSLSVTEKLIASMKIVEDQSVANSIFNYLNVSADTDDLDIIVQTRQEVIRPRHLLHSPLKMQFSSAEPLSLKTDSVFTSRPSSISKKQSTPQHRSSSREKQLNRTSERKKDGRSPQDFQKNKKTLEKMVEQFCSRDNLDTLDLSSYGLSDSNVVEVLKYLKPLKKVKGLKLVKNQVTTEGLSRMLAFIPYVTNLNLSFNQLGEEALGLILASRKEVPLLRIINISNNRINERKAKSSLQELRRQGIIVTI